MLLASDNLWQT